MIHLDQTLSTPLYVQLYRELKRQILEHELRTGERLPATRTLAADYHLSRNTVSAAYAQLEAEGYIISKRGSGFYVEDLPEPSWDTPGDPAAPSARSRERRPEYDFRYGILESNPYHERAFRTCLTNALDSLSLLDTLEYPDLQGTYSLRTALASLLLRTRGVTASPEQIVMTSGHQETLAVLLRHFLPLGYTLAMEDPGYRGTRDIFLHSGAKVRAVPLDENGIRIDALEGLEHAIVAITPSHQFPMGQVMPIRRRLELLEWAERTDSLLLEDDYDSELRYHELPIPSLQSLDRNGRVLYSGTFSKTLSPDLRISYLVFPPSHPYVDPDLFPYSSSPIPTVLQTALTEYLENGEYQKHVNAFRTTMGKKHDLIRSTLTEKLPQVAVHGYGGGMHLVLDLPTDLTEKQWISAFRTRDIGLYPTTPFYASPEADHGNQLLLAYGGIPLKKLSVYLDRLLEAYQEIQTEET